MAIDADAERIAKILSTLQLDGSELVRLGPTTPPLIKFASQSEQSLDLYRAVKETYKKLLQRGVVRNDAALKDLAAQHQAIFKLLEKQNLPDNVKFAVAIELERQNCAFIRDAEMLANDAEMAKLNLKQRVAQARVAGKSLLNTLQNHRAVMSGLLERHILDEIGPFFELGKPLSPGQSLLVWAFNEYSSVIGARWEQGWGLPLEYLVEKSGNFGPKVIKKIRKEILPLDYILNEAIEKGDASRISKLETQIEDKFRDLDNVVRNKVKSLINEGYTSQWPKWLELKYKAVDDAKYVADRLGSRWVALPPKSGKIFLGKRGDWREAWDEAVIVAEKVELVGLSSKAPPQAFPILAAQFKAERTVSGIKQSIQDAIAREESGMYIKYVYDDGEEVIYSLGRAPIDTRVQRFLIAAGGGKFYPGQIILPETAQVSLDAMTHPLSVDHQNALANTILRAFAKVF